MFNPAVPVSYFLMYIFPTFQPAGSSNTFEDVEEDDADVTDFHHYSVGLWEPGLQEKCHEENSQRKPLGVARLINIIDDHCLSVLLFLDTGVSLLRLIYFDF